LLDASTATKIAGKYSIRPHHTEKLKDTLTHGEIAHSEISLDILVLREELLGTNTIREIAGN
jgi:hypothetical protein